MKNSLTISILFLVSCTVPSPIEVETSKQNTFDAHHEFNTIKRIREKGMEYLINFQSGKTFVINLSKDSMEYQMMKQQIKIDSLQLAVYKKYFLNN